MNQEGPVIIPPISHIRIHRLMHFLPFTLFLIAIIASSVQTKTAAVCLALMQCTHIISVSVAVLIPITLAVIHHCNLLLKG